MRISRVAIGRLRATRGLMFVINAGQLNYSGPLRQPDLARRSGEPDELDRKSSRECRLVTEDRKS